MLDTSCPGWYPDAMTRNAQLAYLRRRKAELEGFREPTEGIKIAHKIVTDQILAILTQDQEDALA